jgi:hypothetical protein
MTDALSQIVQELKDINSSLSNSYSWLTTSFSTLFGVIIGGLLTFYSQRIGSVRFYLNNIDFKLFQDDKGRSKKGILFIDIDIVNTKLIPENMREIRLILINQESKKKMLLYNLSITKEFIYTYTTTNENELKVINISPKSINSYSLKSNLEDIESINMLSLNSHVYLIYKNQKNKSKKVRLYQFSKLL